MVEYTGMQLELLNRWKRGAALMAQDHGRSATISKTKHYRLMIPSIIIPLVMAPFEGVAHEYKWIVYVNICAFISSGVASGLAAFFNYSQEEVAHVTAASGYKELITMVDSEFTKPHSVRAPVEMLIQKLQMKLHFIESTAPSIDVAPLVSGALLYTDDDDARIAHNIDLEAAEQHVEARMRRKRRHSRTIPKTSYVARGANPGENGSSISS